MHTSSVTRCEDWTSQLMSKVVTLYTHPRREVKHREYPWNYPADWRDFCNYNVWLSLWNRGYFIGTSIDISPSPHTGSAAKFGGDFLAYTGDPFQVTTSIIIRSTQTVSRPLHRARPHAGIHESLDSCRFRKIGSRSEEEPSRVISNREGWRWLHLAGERIRGETPDSISIDPFYLTYKLWLNWYHSHVVSTPRY